MAENIELPEMKIFKPIEKGKLMTETKQTADVQSIQSS